MSQQEKFNDDKEIDLDDVKARIGESFGMLNRMLYRIVKFFVRNALAIAICFVIGATIGFFLDRSQKVYDNQIVVSPNFGSIDYLYNKVGLIESKIKERDTAFLSAIGIKNADDFNDITIEPVVDIYPLINKSEANFEMIKLMAEDSDMKKIVEDPVTSKNYTFHLITFTTHKRTTREKTVEPLMRYLNDSKFFNDLKKQYANNLQIKMKANDQTIDQINGILSELGSGEKTSNQVYINQNTQLNDVIKTKDELVREQGNIRIEMVSNDKVVKDSSVLINIKNIKSVNGKLKFIFPIVLAFLFLCFKLFMAFYRKQRIQDVRTT